MHVDVLSTVYTTGQAGPNTATHTILQNVKVFSTGHGAEKSTSDKPAATQSVDLLVTPEQAEVLSQAIVQNRIQLVLRNPLDDSSISDALTKVFAPPPPPVTHKVRAVAPAPEKKVEVAEAPRPVAPPPPPTVEIVQGTKRTVTVVAASSGQGVN
jgi:Flp pilus assembly protein CpaB